MWKRSKQINKLIIGQTQRNVVIRYNLAPRQNPSLPIESKQIMKNL